MPKDKCLVLYQRDPDLSNKQGKVLDDFCKLIRKVVRTELIKDVITSPNWDNYQSTYGRRIDPLDDDCCSYGCGRYFCGVALYFPDKRSPSQAGNLSMEVGHWLGVLGDHELLILRHGDAGPSQSFGHIPSEVFRGPSDAAKKLRDFYKSLKSRVGRT